MFCVIVLHLCYKRVTKRKTMKKAVAVIYLDELRPKKDGKCSVKVKVTYNRKRKYFATGINLTPDEFEKIMYAKRRTKKQKDLFTKLNYFENKADAIIDKLPVFTFTEFEHHFFEQRDVTNSVSFAFDKYIDQLKNEKRVGTASSYECAKNSLSSFNKSLTFAEVTAELLKKYENWMLQNGKSLTTVGIYIRSLRAVYNDQRIDRSIYPFGEGKGQYKIPRGQNKKKALTISEIGKIYSYPTEQGTTKDRAKDYWVFLYLSNGMNVKDFCLLKWENIEGEFLTFQRAKTKRSNKEQKTIKVALKAETKAIIQKWGQPSLSKQAYIFPHLQEGMTAEREREVYQQLTKLINKYIKQIANEVGINKPVTSYYARHSFATVLKRSGAKVEMISELLGHSSVGITESYLDSFEDEQIQKETDALTIGFKTA